MGAERGLVVMSNAARARRTRNAAQWVAIHEPGICDVCRSKFVPAAEGQRRCSDECRDFARKNQYAPTGSLPGLWEEAQRLIRPCPSGKVRHQTKRDAINSARREAKRHYSGLPNWLRAYECELCGAGWHLTSKPQRD